MPSTGLTLSNILDKINIRLRRRQFARRRPKLDDVTTVQRRAGSNNSVKSGRARPRSRDLGRSGSIARPPSAARPSRRQRGIGVSAHACNDPFRGARGTLQPKIRATHLLQALGPCFSNGASATKTMTRKGVPDRRAVRLRIVVGRADALRPPPPKPCPSRTERQAAILSPWPGGHFPAKLCATMWQASP